MNKPKSATLLAGHGIRKNFRISRNTELQVLKGIDIRIERGEILAVMDPREPVKAPCCTSSEPRSSIGGKRVDRFRSRVFHER